MKLPKLTALLTVAILTAVTLSACSPYIQRTSSEGQTSKQATVNVESIKGVQKAEYFKEPWSESKKKTALGNNSGMGLSLKVTIDPAYHVVDTKAFLDYTMRTLWSVNDVNSKGNLKVVVVDGVSPNHDWTDEVQSLFEVPYVVGDDANFPNSQNISEEGSTGNISVIRVLDNEVKDVYGSWPGKVPSKPKGESPLVAEGAFTEEQPSALFNINLSTYTSGGKECYALLAHRAELVVSSSDGALTAAGEVYTGDVTIALFSSGVQVEEQVSKFMGNTSEPVAYGKFCFDSKTFPTKNIYVKVSSAEAANFKTVSTKLYR